MAETLHSLEHKVRATAFEGAVKALMGKYLSEKVSIEISDFLDDDRQLTTVLLEAYATNPDERIGESLDSIMDEHLAERKKAREKTTIRVNVEATDNKDAMEACLNEIKDLVAQNGGNIVKESRPDFIADVYAQLQAKFFPGVESDSVEKLSKKTLVFLTIEFV